MGERALQSAILDLADMMGLLSYHTHDSRRSRPGFPDLVVVGRKVAFIELKSATGRVSPTQRQWLEALERAGQIVHVLRPEDWPHRVQGILRSLR